MILHVNPLTVFVIIEIVLLWPTELHETVNIDV